MNRLAKTVAVSLVLAQPLAASVPIYAKASEQEDQSSAAKTVEGQIQKVVTAKTDNQTVLNQVSDQYNALSATEKSQVENAGQLTSATKQAAVKAQGALQAQSAAAEPMKSEKTITMTVERFVLGQGYIVEPKQVKVTQDMNYATLLDQELKAENLAYSYKGSLASSFYLAGINGVDLGNPKLPSAITKLAKDGNVDISTTNQSAPDLKEFSYSFMSGWMYSVNNVFPGVGMSDKKPADGDVFRLQFTLVGYGADLGQSFGGDDAISVADKTALTKKVGEINQDKATFEAQGTHSKQAYTDAMKELEDLTAPQKDVDTALAELNDAKAEDQQQADETAAKAVMDQIDQLPSVDQVTKADQAKVDAAAASYKKLTADQQKLVTNYAKVTSLQEKLTALNQAVDPNEALKSATARIKVNNPTTVGEWDALALVRGGNPAELPEREASYQALADTITKNGGKYGTGGAPWTDAERQAIGIVALGGDPTDVNGINLIKLMIDNELKGTINNQIYGLIALSTKDYGISGQKDKIQSLLTSLEGSQLPDGGWALFGKTSDIDITGMTLTALAPYKNQPEVKAVIDKGVTYLKSKLTDDADFFAKSMFSTSPNSNSQDQAIIGLTAVGEDLTSGDYVKGGTNPIQRLISYQLDNGGFKWLATDNRENAMATQQAVHALAQYQFAKQGKGLMYDFDKNPVELLPEVTDKAQAKKVSALIEALPAVDQVKLTDQKAVNAANDAFNQLTENGKKLVSSADQTKLTQELAQLQQQLADAKSAAAKVEAQIEALPAVDQLKITDESTVNAADKAFNQLNTTAKELVSPTVKEKLDQAKARLAQLVTAKEAAKKVETQIEALPAIDQLKLADQKSVDNTNQAFNQLNADAKALVSSEAQTKLTQELAQLQKLANVSLNVKDSNLTVGDKWQAKDNFVSATDQNKQAVDFSKVKVIGADQVNVNAAGTYKVTYQYGDITKTATITVTKVKVVVMLRLYNPNSGEHFYTSNPGEKANLVKHGWKDEGIAWNAPEKGEPVYRFYNKNAGDHHYTKIASERDFLKKSGWSYEGVAWYSGGTKPVYRFYNKNAKAGAHHYTLLPSERDFLKKSGWSYEGVAWNAE